MKAPAAVATVVTGESVFHKVSIVVVVTTLKKINTIQLINNMKRGAEHFENILSRCCINFEITET